MYGWATSIGRLTQQAALVSRAPLGALEPRWVCWHRGVEPPSGVQLGAVLLRAISRVLLRPLGQLADAWRDGHYIVLGRRQVGAA